MSDKDQSSTSFATKERILSTPWTPHPSDDCHVSPADFYTAWRVVRRTFPTLPDDPRVAARWASLLAHGALDARAEPDLVAEVLSLLLEAAKVRVQSVESRGLSPWDLCNNLSG